VRESFRIAVSDSCAIIGWDVRFRLLARDYERLNKTLEGWPGLLWWRCFWETSRREVQSRVRAIDLELAGTDREISARFDRETSATQVDRAMCSKVSALVNLARYAVRRAGQRRRQSVA
jgi:hypothetical protein